MFSLDDRAGNVVTTVALFMAAATILYLARGAFVILLLSLLFAYLLEPAVTLVQKHSLGQKNRTWAIAEVYLIGTIALGSLGYVFGPRLAEEITKLNAKVPDILESLSSGKTVNTLEGRHGLSAAQQLRIQDLLARHHDFIANVFERGAASAAHVAASAIWLLAVPILAIFFLQDGRQMVAATIDAVGSRGDGTLFKKILQQVDTMLAKYIRAQFTLAALSFAFYSVSMLVLRYPYAIALGVLGGVLEFLPAVGWIVSAVAILTTGLLTHTHWIWMAGLLLVWRLVQNYVNSPRIMGDNLELRPLTVVFALMVGAQVGGIAGVYLSVPVVAVLRIVWLECFSTRNSPTEFSDQPLMQVKA